LAADEKGFFFFYKNLFIDVLRIWIRVCIFITAGNCLVKLKKFKSVSHFFQMNTLMIIDHLSLTLSTEGEKYFSLHFGKQNNSWSEKFVTAYDPLLYAVI
jgi:hypothetical protein